MTKKNKKINDHYEHCESTASRNIRYLIEGNDEDSDNKSNENEASNIDVGPYQDIDFYKQGNQQSKIQTANGPLINIGGGTTQRTTSYVETEEDED